VEKVNPLLRGVTGVFSSFARPASRSEARDGRGWGGCPFETFAIASNDKSQMTKFWILSLKFGICHLKFGFLLKDG
jgi:hypothetical protein